MIGRLDELHKQLRDDLNGCPSPWFEFAVFAMLDRSGASPADMVQRSGVLASRAVHLHALLDAAKRFKDRRVFRRELATMCGQLVANHADRNASVDVRGVGGSILLASAGSTAEPSRESLYALSFVAGRKNRDRGGPSACTRGAAYSTPSPGGLDSGDMMKEPPVSRDDVDEFLGRVRDIRSLLRKCDKCDAPCLLMTPLVLQRLAERLLDADCRHLLDSEEYRTRLILHTRRLLYHEIIEMTYRCMTEVYRQKPIRNCDGRDLLGAYIWTISEFGHVVLGVDRRLAACDNLRQALEHEVLLYHHRTAYRDHLLHALHVFCVGLLLVESPGSPVKSLVPSGKRKLDMLRNLYVAALFHDLGYGMEVYPSIFRISGHLQGDDLMSLNKRIKEAYAEGVAEINAKITSMDPGCTIPTRPDHGVFSYLHLKSVIERVDKDRPFVYPGDAKVRVRQEYEAALHAVRLHSLTGSQVVARERPLTAVLVLCDEMQDWGRRGFGTNELLDGSASLINFRAVGSLPDERICEPIHFHGYRLKKGLLSPARGLQPVAVMVYRDQNDNCYEPLLVLLKKIYNLERIIGIEGVDLRIEAWVPWLSNSTERTLPEVDILREFVCETNGSYIGTDLINTSYANRNRACSWLRMDDTLESCKGRRYSVLTLNLPQFGLSQTSPLVSRNPNDFRKELWDFKKRFCQKKGVACRFFDRDDAAHP